jgi:hypothetical protein
MAPVPSDTPSPIGESEGEEKNGRGEKERDGRDGREGWQRGMAERDEKEGWERGMERREQEN